MSDNQPVLSKVALGTWAACLKQEGSNNKRIANKIWRKIQKSM